MPRRMRPTASAATTHELDGEVFGSQVLPEDLTGWFEEAGCRVAWDGEPLSNGEGYRRVALLTDHVTMPDMIKSFRDRATERLFTVSV